MSICIVQVCLGDNVPLSNGLIWSMMMCHSLEERAAISLTNTLISSQTLHQFCLILPVAVCLRCFGERAPKLNCDTNLR